MADEHWGISPVRTPEKEDLQEAIVTCIREYTAERGFAPTYKEIGEIVGIRSTSNVSYHLDRLVTSGRVTRVENLSRTLRVVEDDEGRKG